MENYAAFIMLIAVGCGLIDMLTDRWPAVQRQLFPVLTLVLYTLYICTYYYGPDIWTYVPYYEDIKPPKDIWAMGDNNQFEIGYSMFCSFMHSIGLSYWWMTWVIKTLYFTAVWLLLRRLPKRQIFALSCIVLADTNLVLHETRQCLAVSFFIFMVLLMQQRRYLWALVCAVLTVAMHKSGFIPVALTVVGVAFYHKRQYASVYTLLAMVLLALVALPVQRISASMLDVLPLPDSYIESLSHHLLLGRQFQTIAIIYLSLLLAFSLYLSYDRKSRYTWIAFTAMAGMIVIVLLYPYYFLLIRMRSYFVPFIVFYLVKVLSNEQLSKAVHYSTMIKQALMVLVLVYYIHYTLGIERGSRQLHSPVFRACTVLELRHAEEWQIRNRQMGIAYKYWTQDYMQAENNKL